MKTKSSKCKIIVFSDIHYTTGKPTNKESKVVRKLIHYAIPLVHKLIEKINEVNPDFAVSLGDLIEDSGDYDKNIIDLKFIWDLLKGIKIPFYSNIGNQDLQAVGSRREIEQIMGYKNATFSIDLKGYHFVFLAPETNKNEEDKKLKNQYFSTEDREWLKKDLQKNTLPCLVFSHFPIAEDDMAENVWFRNCFQNAFWANRNEVREILANDKNLLSVFSGHQHWTKELQENRVDYHVIGSLVEDIDNNGIPDGIYFEVDLEGENIHITKHHLRL